MIVAHARRAFTLIELLIVVAIIAILAAIAIPNMLEAQVRAKVSRARNDLRTLATAIESYMVDYQRPPYDGEPGDPHWGWATAQAQLTTPIAYISTVMADVFQDTGMPDATIPGHSNYMGPNRTRHTFDYSTASWENLAADPAKTAVWLRHLGPSPYKIASAGPDLEFDNAGSFYGLRQIYHPTNGTTSLGDIPRSSGVIW